MRTHIQRSLSAIVAAVALLSSTHALADKASIKANLGAARERLVALVNGGEPGKLKPEIAELTAKIDAEADTVAGFKPVWEQFKANRDGKIIPAYDGTNPDGKEAAKALAMGEQKQLLEKMMGMLN